MVDAAQHEGRRDVALVAEEHALEHGARRHDARGGACAQPQQVQLRAVGGGVEMGALSWLEVVGRWWCNAPPLWMARDVRIDPIRSYPIQSNPFQSTRHVKPRMLHGAPDELRGLLRVGRRARAAAVDVGRQVVDLLAVLVGHLGAARGARVGAQHHAVLVDDAGDGRARLHGLSRGKEKGERRSVGQNPEQSRADCRVASRRSTREWGVLASGLSIYLSIQARTEGKCIFFSAARPALRA